MNVHTSYMLAICTLFATNTFPQSGESDTIRTAQQLIFDTLDLNLAEPCYDAAFYKDGIIFLKPGEENVYLTPMDRPEPEFSRPLFTNKEIPCSPAALSFSGDYSKGYYTNSVKTGKGPYLEKMYEMSIRNNEVSDIRQLPFTIDSSRNLHPAISSDGMLMIFSSDRLPTSGGLDLFVSRKTGTGWSEPENIGASVNTSGHEWFPFLDSRNNLLFSSTGHSGYGGYDLYFCAYEKEGWGPAQNLGNSINGPENEWGISIHSGQKSAIFSRTQISGPGGMALMLTLDKEYLSNISLFLQERADPAVKTEPPHQVPPVVEPETKQREEPAPNPTILPGNIVFRVQIISSLNENSFPTVLIGGVSYTTYEYFYKGAYRVTVGEFESAKEANAFRTLCVNSGFKQAFVAAFRGDQRETDPSVFK